ATARSPRAKALNRLRSLPAWNLRDKRCAPAGRALHGEASIQRGDTIGEPTQSAVCGKGSATGAIVANFDFQHVILLPVRYSYVRGAAVLGDVRQRLRHDEIRG